MEIKTAPHAGNKGFEKKEEIGYSDFFLDFFDKNSGYLPNVCIPLSKSREDRRMQFQLNFRSLSNQVSRAAGKWGVYQQASRQMVLNTMIVKRNPDEMQDSAFDAFWEVAKHLHKGVEYIPQDVMDRFFQEITAINTLAVLQRVSG